jgi:hypothetical protein
MVIVLQMTIDAAPIKFGIQFIFNEWLLHRPDISLSKVYGVT